MKLSVRILRCLASVVATDTPKPLPAKMLARLLQGKPKGPLNPDGEAEVIDLPGL
jgi:hypothetical protein